MEPWIVDPWIVEPGLWSLGCGAWIVEPGLWSLGLWILCTMYPGLQILCGSCGLKSQ